MKILYSILAIIALTFSGCATTETTALTGPNIAATPVPVNVNATDPVVIDAEKTLLIARDTFNLYVHLERDNQTVFAKIGTQPHQLAETIRRNGIKWLRTGDSMKEAYKHNRTAANRANLATILATISESLNQSQQYIRNAGFNTP